MKKCSAILLNYKRSKNLRNEILRDILDHPLINEVIVSHGLPETYFTNFPRIKHLKHFVEQSRTGLFRRLTTATIAKNDYLLYIDDDIKISNDGLTTLLSSLDDDPFVIHGLFGRDCSTSRYIMKDVKGQTAPIIGGRAFSVTKENVQAALNIAHLIDPYMHDFPVKWNGEDIFLSLSTLLRNRRLNRVHPNIKYVNLPDEHAISHMPGHHAQRNLIVKKCFDILPGLKQALGPNHFES